ncbi:MAG TPA: multicopper oxidase domain-containing protein [Syntrophorhabdaceae bacterium]|nr:multicopper oxidase domain-containing protein [Syntrophorhabdaceae bacterium]
MASLVLFILLAHVYAQATSVEYDLTISQLQANITGKSAQSMAINGGIPGPTLRFKKGDTARIHVHNNMNVDTSIHWHGVLVPPGMDGVPYLSFPPIKPGEIFTYEFPIRQSGTYWYHSHTGMQQQSGVYGAIIIEALRNDPKSDRDHVVILSDWTDEDPHEVSRTLKRGSDWYALKKGSAQSILGAARLGMLGDYFKREIQRMQAMDIADVAYDRFLANGRPELIIPAEPNETVRLRIIDGSSTTYFHLEFAGGPMTIIAADGQDVEPIKETRFLVGAAETYDVFVQIPSAGAYEFRATAHDGSGYTSVWLGSGERISAPDIPKPNLYHTMGNLSLKQIFSLTPAGAMGMPDSDVDAGKFDRPGMMDMSAMGMNHSADHSKMKTDDMDHASSAGMGHPLHNDDMSMEHPVSPAKDMEHTGHSMPNPPQVSRIKKEHGTDFGFLADDVAASKDLALDGMDSSRPWPPYAKLRSLSRTVFSKDRPVREIRFTLDGDMERYVWFINNKPLSESDSIRIHEGEVVRFIMINRTMMHHPMHLHGHFFRVINDQGDYAPLKHTVDVAPMSTTVIEFDANEFGDWFFHCHLLYHMEAGMASIVHYEGFTPTPQLASIRSELHKDLWYFWGQADALSNMTEGFLTLSNTRNILSAEWEVGWQNTEATTWETLFTWDRYVNGFFTIFAGANVMGQKNHIDKTRGVLGFRYLLPLNLESRVWIDTDRGVRFNLAKSFELTPRLALFGEVEYDTHDKWEGVAGLSYTINKTFSLVGQWHSDYGFGGGLQIRF